MSNSQFDPEAFLDDDSIWVAGPLQRDAGEELLEVHFLFIQGTKVAVGRSTEISGDHWLGKAKMPSGEPMTPNAAESEIPHDKETRAIGVAVSRKPLVERPENVGLTTFTWCVPVKLYADEAAADAAKLERLSAAPIAAP